MWGTLRTHAHTHTQMHTYKIRKTLNMLLHRKFNLLNCYFYPSIPLHGVPFSPHFFFSSMPIIVRRQQFRLVYTISRHPLVSAVSQGTHRGPWGLYCFSSSCAPVHVWFVVGNKWDPSLTLPTVGGDSLVSAHRPA